MTKIQKRMSEYCVGRSKNNLILLHEEYFSSIINIYDFLAIWTQLARVLNYPKSELMYLDDELLDIMEIHNRVTWYFILFSFPYFEDIEDILEAFEIEFIGNSYFSDIAREQKIGFSTVGDLLIFIGSEFGY